MTIFEIIIIILTAMGFTIAMMTLVVKIINISLHKKEITRPRKGKWVILYNNMTYCLTAYKAAVLLRGVDAPLFYYCLVYYSYP